MGAIDAFSKAFSLVSENKSLYVPLLLAMLLLSLFGWAIGLTSLPNHEPVEKVSGSGSVIFEEYGSVMPEIGEELVAKLLVYLILALIVLSALQYGVVKGFKLSLELRDYSLGELISDGIRHAPGVILVNLLGGLLFLVVFAGVALLIVGIALVVPPLAVLLGVLMILALLPLAIAYFSILVPAYVEEGELSVFVHSLHLVLRNPLPSMGFGLLMLLFAVAVGIAMAPLTAIAKITTNNGLVVSLIEAPFNAFIQFYTLAAGLLFYRELAGNGEETPEELFY